MTTLRDELYAKYVTAFKGDPTARVDVPKFWAWCDHKLGPWIRDLPESAEVLELGCGPGYLMGYFRQRGYANVEGIDLSAEQVSLAQSMGHEAVVADVFEYLAGKPNAYDLILAFDFFEHFHRDELKLLTDRIRTALKPGGRLILQTPNGQGLFCGHIVYGDLTHATIFNPGSLGQLLALAGFERVEFRESGGAPVGILGWGRSVAWRVMRMGLNVACKIATGRTYAIWTDNMLCMCRRGTGIPS